MIYLDYNASVPLRPAAKKALVDALAWEGNPSSPHRAGRELRALVEWARAEILERTEAPRLVFTSGGTEANALIFSNAAQGPVVVSSIEHDSVRKAVDAASFIPVTRAGVIDLEALEKLLVSFEKPGLLSVMLVNNETGVIQPVRDAVRLAHAKGWKVHTDASQAIGHLPVSFKDLEVDFMTISSHKCGGPAGIGALLMHENVHLAPLYRGGGQEYGMRSGIVPVPLIMGFSAALKEAVGEDSRALGKFQQKIEAGLPEAIIYGQKSPRVPQVMCLGMPMVPADLQLMAFDLKGIAVSAGAACSSGTMKTSHVLAAMGIPPQEAHCAVRVSMGWKTQETEIEIFIHEWKTIFEGQRLRKAS